MFTTRCVWVLLVLALAVPSADAQMVFVGGSGLSGAYVLRRSKLYVGVGSVYGWPSPYYFRRAARVTLVYAPPPVIIAVPVPEPQLKTERRDDDPAPLPERQMPGRDAGVFRPLEADNRARAERPVLQPPPEVPRRQKASAPPSRPEAPPSMEALVQRGRAAFGDGEFGRGLDFFRRAAAMAPRDALPQFLLSQAYLALGKYPEAVDAIRAGMALRRDWPAAAFRPAELYGAFPEGYAETMDRLQDAVMRHPRDPMLLFLIGHQRWFEGRQAEARTFFQRARRGFAHPGIIDRFLGVPDDPVVRAG